MPETLELLSHLAAIATAVLAAWAWIWYQWDRRQKRLRLENYLKDGCWNGLSRARTLIALMAELGMSEREIMDAAFRSNSIERKVRVDNNGRAVELLLEYKCADLPPQQRF